jgi:beta-lactamase class A
MICCTVIAATVGLILSLGALADAPATQPGEVSLDDGSPVDAALQGKIEAIDSLLRGQFGMSPEQASVAVVDLRRGRVALINPDRLDYAASVPKIGILLAYFAIHPESAERLDPAVRDELGRMIKISSNELAAKYSRELGLKQIQGVLSANGFYDEARGGGIWVGKHYGKDAERYGDPIGDHSHAATVRQVARFLLLMEQGRLLSPVASRTMREIFESPDIPHDQVKFVKGLAGRNVQIIRKSGTWKHWLHDAAVVTGPGRHYILVAMTAHERGDEYLTALAPLVDDLMVGD